MPVYIKASSLVSTQNTFGEKILQEDHVVFGKNCNYIIDPNYKDFIAPSMLRRMSRLVKYSLVSALDCLNQTEDLSVDTIITATGLGCVNDTGVFLTQMHENKEKLLNPTAFIRSTHNAVGGQIALIKKLHVSNLSYTQKEVSFETGLLDALMLFDEGEANNILIGAFDELTELKADLWKQMRCLSETAIDLSTLKRGNTRGTTLGEGAGFFVLSAEADNANCSKIEGVEIHRSLSGSLKDSVSNFLAKHKLKNSDIDLIILGLDGTPTTLHLLLLIDREYETATVAGFKHLSGTYDTDSVFALWLANSAIVNSTISSECVLRGEQNKKFKNVLIVNSSKQKSFSFILLSGC